MKPWANTNLDLCCASRSRFPAYQEQKSLLCGAAQLRGVFVSLGRARLVRRKQQGDLAEKRNLCGVGGLGGTLGTGSRWISRGIDGRERSGSRPFRIQARVLSGFFVG